ncbi:MAG: carbohydrate kinase [Bacteroidales bacterium]|nr:carbohydrate kinase [Bacteroidales bacterium]
MKRIFCIGETVYDIIFQAGQPVAARPGGSMLNSAVSCGRMGLPTYFISEYGQDLLGLQIDSFLTKNGVGIDFIYHFTKGKTSIALAFLDEYRNASYSFYKDLPSERMLINIPEFSANDYVLFGSFYAINPEIRDKILTIISKAKHAGATIIYDPNFRKAHLNELPLLLPMIEENMQLASVVKASDEDLQMIFGSKGFNESYKIVSKYCPVLIYTQGSNEVVFKSPVIQVEKPTKKITPLSTIGAGDSFSAGLLYYLYSKQIDSSHITNLSTDDAKKLIETGIDFASDVCLSYDNYISHEFAQNFQL